MKPHHHQKGLARQEAQSAAYTLFQQAASTVNKNPALANRYISLARKLAMKYNLRLPAELKRRFCKHCYAFLLPGVTSRVRVAKQRVIITCFGCKKYGRYPLRRR